VGGSWLLDRLLKFWNSLNISETVEVTHVKYGDRLAQNECKNAKLGQSESGLDHVTSFKILGSPQYLWNDNDDIYTYLTHM